MKVEKEKKIKGVVKSWREKHKSTFEEEKEIVWQKVDKREEEMRLFSLGEIFIENWPRYRLLMKEYLEKKGSAMKWGERRRTLDKVAKMIGEDESKSFMMLDFYRMECSNSCAEKMIRKYGGSFGWTRYEWLMHWHRQFGVYENSQLQRWVEKGRFGGSTD